jgi:hypothetical protein
MEARKMSATSVARDDVNNTPAQLVDLQETTSFVLRFFAGTIHTWEFRVFARVLADDGTVRDKCIDRLFTRQVNDVLGLIKRHSDKTITFGITTREGGGTKKHCRELIALFTDLDGTLTLEQLQAFQPRPSLIVASGGEGRFHC